MKTFMTESNNAQNFKSLKQYCGTTFGGLYGNMEISIVYGKDYSSASFEMEDVYMKSNETEAIEFETRGNSLSLMFDVKIVDGWTQITDGVMIYCKGNVTFKIKYI